MSSNNQISGIVSLRGLRKRYDGKPPVEAVAGIDLDVREGEIYGLLGPNGAGKTTTISICTTRVLPTAGTAHIAGVDVVRNPAQARRYMGVVPQYNTLERSCTVAENIQFHCLYFGFSKAEAKARTAELLDQFHLSERAKIVSRATVRWLGAACADRPPSPTALCPGLPAALLHRFRGAARRPVFR